MVTETQTLVLGGGCFWCTEAVFVRVKGITDVESGYSNGKGPRPSYDDVCTGNTGYNEVVKLTYDPAQISTQQILEIFFLIHDPTTRDRQGNDIGTQYRSGVYYTTPEQQQKAVCVIDGIRKGGFFGKNLVTEVLPLAQYWPAEDYHQDFFARNPTQGYCMAVAAPKVEKFRRTFAELVRD